MRIQSNPLFIGFPETYSGTAIHAKPMSEYVVRNPVLILPDGSVDYYETVVFALRRNKRLCVIMERGGQNCHLLVSAREKTGLSLFHLPHALELVPDGSEITVSQGGAVDIVESVPVFSRITLPAP